MAPGLAVDPNFQMGVIQNGTEKISFERCGKKFWQRDGRKQCAPIALRDKFSRSKVSRDVGPGTVDILRRHIVQHFGLGSIAGDADAQRAGNTGSSHS